jgi:membrane-associated phospholipid phosphatase
MRADIVCRSLAFSVVAVILSSSPLVAQTDQDIAPVKDTAATTHVAPGLFDPVTVGAQVITQPAGPAPTPRHTGFKALGKDLLSDFRHLPSRENLFWVGVGSDTAEKIFKLGEPLGELPTLLSAAAVTYAVGRIKGEPKVSHVGMDLIQALVVSETITQTMKHIARRERPDGSGPTSFPSGHAADTFAFATALERHLGWKGAVPAYAFASYVAISRLPANRHWFSDAVFGASVGIIAGRTVTRHGREFPVTVAAVPGGAAIVYTRPNR